MELLTKYAPGACDKDSEASVDEEDENDHGATPIKKSRYTLQTATPNHCEMTITGAPHTHTPHTHPHTDHLRSSCKPNVP